LVVIDVERPSDARVFATAVAGIVLMLLGAGDARAVDCVTEEALSAPRDGATGVPLNTLIGGGLDFRHVVLYGPDGEVETERRLVPMAESGRRNSGLPGSPGCSRMRGRRRSRRVLHGFRRKAATAGASDRGWVRPSSRRSCSPKQGQHTQPEQCSPGPRGMGCRGHGAAASSRARLGLNPGGRDVRGRYRWPGWHLQIGHVKPTREIPGQIERAETRGDGVFPRPVAADRPGLEAELRRFGEPLKNRLVSVEGEVSGFEVLRQEHIVDRGERCRCRLQLTRQDAFDGEVEREPAWYGVRPREHDGRWRHIVDRAAGRKLTGEVGAPVILHRVSGVREQRFDGDVHWGRCRTPPAARRPPPIRVQRVDGRWGRLLAGPRAMVSRSLRISTPPTTPRQASTAQFGAPLVRWSDDARLVAS
jgi:hypothetical protein